MAKVSDKVVDTVQERRSGNEIMSRITTGRMDPELKSLASAYAMHPSIEAVVVSGSIRGALAD